MFLDVRLPFTEYVQGGTVHGEVLLKAERTSRRIKGIKLELLEEWYEGEGREKNRHSHNEIVARMGIAGEVIVNQDKVLELPFTLHLPSNLAISSDHQRCFLRVQVVVAFLPDITRLIELTIKPSPAITAVWEALACHLGFISCGLMSASRQQVFKFCSGPGTPEDFRHIKHIEMIFVNEENCLRIHMKAKVDLLGNFDADNYFTLVIPYQEMFRSDGTPAHQCIGERIIRRLWDALRPVGKSHLTGQEPNC
ncbi:sporulation protein [Desulfofundulus sp.]|uniref:sporulation protein n=1 Tax=Desulfofundulus sp. TaxID=2282750 RepID=UPI003C7273E3